MKNLFTLIFTLLAVSLVAQDTYFTESFDKGLPGNWTVEGAWSFGAPADLGSQYFAVPEDGTGNMAVFNDDAIANSFTDNGTITSAPIDLTAVTGPMVLEFRSYFRNGDYQGGDETAKIALSSDMGETFTEIASIHSKIIGEGGETNSLGAFFVDISEYAGMNIMLSFTYDDGGQWNYGWAMDEVAIRSEITFAPRMSYILSAGSSPVIDGAQEGIDYVHDGFMINNGYEVITSFDIVMSNGTDEYTKSFTGLDVGYNELQKYLMDPILVSGDQSFTVSITNINGDVSAIDDTPANNAGAFNLNAVKDLNPNRGVLVEEATGTWCQFCPNGTVHMDEMAKRFPDNFVGVAVHNTNQNVDPMLYAEYDAELTSFPGFPGFPSAVRERTNIVEFGDIYSETTDLMTEAPIATITVGAETNGSDLTTSLRVDFLEDVEDGDYSLAVIITEDNVTGTTVQGYTQVNAWSGADEAGVTLGGYEYLPGSVPGSFNVFNHVARELIGGHEGTDEAIEGSYVAGNTDGWVFDAYEIPNTINPDNMHIIGILINDDGEVVNAASASLLDAVSEGLYSNVATKAVFDATIADIYPNPVNEVANIEMSLTESAEVTVNVINSLGQTVSSRNYGQQSGNFKLQQDVSNLTEGMYMMHISAGDRFISKKINKVN